jgi:hypothetical protein
MRVRLSQGRMKIPPAGVNMACMVVAAAPAGLSWRYRRVSFLFSFGFSAR